MTDATPSAASTEGRAAPSASPSQLWSFRVGSSQDGALLKVQGLDSGSDSGSGSAVEARDAQMAAIQASITPELERMLHVSLFLPLHMLT